MAIINDDDMEIILKGNQDEAIRKMLKDRLFCLIKMSAKKPERITSPCSSSVFVGCLNGWTFRSFAIRKDGSKTLYSDCEYYLSIYEKRGTDEELSGYFESGIERIKEHTISITNPSVDELLSFLKNQELVLITNYMHYLAAGRVRKSNFPGVQHKTLPVFTDSVKRISSNRYSKSTLFYRAACRKTQLMRAAG